jgi:hypothetical protein
MTDETVAFPDCVQPEACECHLRLRSFPDYGGHMKCMIPRINALAIKLGWHPPYDYFPIRFEGPPHG